MRYLTSTLSTIAALAATAGLMGAGCGTSNDGDSAAHQIQPLLSATSQTDTGERTAFTFGYSASEGWTIRGDGPASVSGIEVRRQAAQHGGGSVTRPDVGTTTGGTGTGGQSGSSSTQATFDGTAGATVRFYGSANASSRFSGQAPANAQFSGTSSGSSRFHVNVSSKGGSCNLQAYCDYAAAICSSFSGDYFTPFVESCDESDIRQCYGNVEQQARSEEELFSYAQVCFLAPFIQCAAEGIRSAGQISTHEQLTRAQIRGVENCGLDPDDAEIEVEVTTSVDGTGNNGTPGPDVGVSSY